MIGAFEGQYRFLSNYYAIPQGIDLYAEPWLTPAERQLLVPTVEHGLHVAKFQQAGDRHAVLHRCSSTVPCGMAACTTPGQAKRAGRKGQLRSDWEAVKEG